MGRRVVVKPNTGGSDNRDISSKLELRRYFLEKYHSGEEEGVSDSIKVFDCCQGSGVIWTHLQEEYSVDNYWGVDVKAKKGRIAVDSSRILSQPGWKDNVIDIDTYGAPWKHWLCMLPNVVRPTTVFLTIGGQKNGVRASSNVELKAIGVTLSRLPGALRIKLAKHTLMHLLARACARYIGVRLMPKKTEAPAGD